MLRGLSGYTGWLPRPIEAIACANLVIDHVVRDALITGPQCEHHVKSVREIPAIRNVADSEQGT